ncbi:hypothetical protein PL8927_60034 [Planktothrix serta PCC 8927]|uniref:Uncharacterized protein n=1 Tax=Planktothrix serta PCC 8927 TaxID=671068 RepID=A0A7Z9BQF0_9CYAN|nr:hypothetical protein PL8927_60034 [Planktothrix serta PCC 8927]
MYFSGLDRILATMYTWLQAMWFTFAKRGINYGACDEGCSCAAWVKRGASKLCRDANVWRYCPVTE